MRRWIQFLVVVGLFLGVGPAHADSKVDWTPYLEKPGERVVVKPTAPVAVAAAKPESPREKKANAKQAAKAAKAAKAKAAKAKKAKKKSRSKSRGKGRR